MSEDWKKIIKEEDDFNEVLDLDMDFWELSWNEQLEFFNAGEQLEGQKDAFEELSGLDEFVKKKCVQNIKKITHQAV